MKKILYLLFAFLFTACSYITRSCENSIILNVTDTEIQSARINDTAYMLVWSIGNQLYCSKQSDFQGDDLFPPQEGNHRKFGEGMLPRIRKIDENRYFITHLQRERQSGLFSLWGGFYTLSGNELDTREVCKIAEGLKSQLYDLEVTGENEMGILFMKSEGIGIYRINTLLPACSQQTSDFSVIFPVTESILKLKFVAGNTDIMVYYQQNGNYTYTFVRKGEFERMNFSTGGNQKILSSPQGFDAAYDFKNKRYLLFSLSDNIVTRLIMKETNDHIVQINGSQSAAFTLPPFKPADGETTEQDIYSSDPRNCPDCKDGCPACRTKLETFFTEKLYRLNGVSNYFDQNNDQLVISISNSIDQNVKYTPLSFCSNFTTSERGNASFNQNTDGWYLTTPSDCRAKTVIRSTINDAYWIKYQMNDQFGHIVSAPAGHAGLRKNSLQLLSDEPSGHQVCINEGILQELK